ncbi:hypothetical protein V8C42DRAFT_314871 [Trichoderma barbatum]
MDDINQEEYAPCVYRGSDGILYEGPGKRKLSELTRDELLWLLRTDYEERHRNNIRVLATTCTYDPSIRDASGNCLPDILDYQWLDICNKSVPLYILPGDRWILLRIVLHNYIYRRWFRPYRSEIDFWRFICKFIIPKDLPDYTTVSLSTVHAIISLNREVITKFEAQRITYLEQRAAARSWVNSWGNPKNLDPYVLQPLFRALIIIVSDEGYNKETSAMLGNLPVYLARTGAEDGLSAPISFEPIAAKISSHTEPGRVVQVTLETAIDFIIGLEAREAAAFGLRPNPITDWEPDNYMVEAWESIGETKPLVGPNSEWVNDERYPQWSEGGKHVDFRLMAQHEEREFRFEARREARAEEYKEAQRAADAAGESAADAHGQ